MLDIMAGMVVKSKAGHDKNNFYVIMKIEDGFAFVADGKNKTIDCLKRKNLKHLSKTNLVLDVNTLDSNKKIRRILWPYKYGTEISIAD